MMKAFESQRQKTFLRTSVPNEDSDQPAYSRSRSESFLDVFWIAKDAKVIHADKEDSEQSAWMRKLI